MCQVRTVVSLMAVGIGMFSVSDWVSGGQTMTALFLSCFSALVVERTLASYASTFGFESVAAGLPQETRKAAAAVTKMRSFLMA
jgi:hypothetical protein